MAEPSAIRHGEGQVALPLPKDVLGILVSYLPLPLVCQYVTSLFVAVVPCAAAPHFCLVHFQFSIAPYFHTTAANFF